eukprot:13871687-Ditylum_brightwellii.AAC.1
MGLLSGTSTAQTKGVKASIHKKHNLHWSRWEEFVKKVGHPDPFLDGLGTYPKSRIISAFMESVQRGNYSRGCTEGAQSATTQ